MTKSKAPLLASRLRAVTSMPEYIDTIGSWLKEAEAAAIHEMSVAKEQVDYFKAQGSYKAVRSIFQQIESVLAAEEAALKKQKDENDRLARS